MTRDPLRALPALPSLSPEQALIDSHCHLDMEDFGADRSAVLTRAATAGIRNVITVGAGGPLDANFAAVRLANTHDALFATVGIHPHEASTVNESVIDTVTELARDPKVVAIGETGLDYHYDHSARPQQREAFRQFIRLARRVRLPIVVHLRAADDDAMQILREEEARDVGGVIHCFSSDARSARAFLDLGLYLSFSGIVTFKNADAVREAAALVPRDRVLVETDAPFLAPVPFRGRRNEPALVVYTAALLAQLRGQSIDAIAADTEVNTQRLFRLPPHPVARLA